MVNSNNNNDNNVNSITIKSNNMLDNNGNNNLYTNNDLNLSKSINKSIIISGSQTKKSLSSRYRKNT